MLRHAAALALTAATLVGSAAPDRRAALPPAEGHLDLVAYPGYAEAGGNDPRANWVTPFVQATGCKVRVQTVHGATELLKAVEHGHHDGVAAFGDIAQVLVDEGLVSPLDPRLIPRYASVYPTLRRLPQNRAGGRVVGVPAGRSPDVLLWRTDRIGRAPHGWGALFDGRYAGEVGLYDGAITLAGTAIHLGYRDPYELDPRQFRAVVRLAAEQRALVGAYWHDLTTAEASYMGGNALVGEASPRLAALLRADEVPIRTAIPAGGTARSASWMLLAHAPHPGCLYRWLGYVLSPRVDAAAARYRHDAPATPAACRFLGCAAVHAGDERWWARLSFWRTPRRDCGDGRGDVCADWFEWAQAWAAIRAG